MGINTRARHLDPGDDLPNRQAGPDGTFRIVFVRPRIAEIDQHAIAHELGHMALVARDLAGNGVLIAAHGVPQVFRVQALGQFRRADEVDEHDRHLAALGLALRRRLGGRWLIRPIRRTLAQRSDRREQDPAVAQQNAQLSEILLGQMRHGTEIDAVLSEGLGVSAELQFFQPRADLVRHILVFRAAASESVEPFAGPI